MRVTIIGCDSACPLAGSATSAYIVEEGECRLMLDCGSGALSLMQKAFDFDTVGHIILSHFHPDHVADVGVAIYSRLVSMQLGREVGPLTVHALEDRDFTTPYSRFAPIDETSRLEIGPCRIRFHRTVHPVPCLAMRLEAGSSCLVYTADGALDEDLVEFCKGAHLVIAECSFHPGKGRPAQTGHMDPESVSRLAIQALIPRLVLSHLPVYGDRMDILEYVRVRVPSSCAVTLASPLEDYVI